MLLQDLEQEVIDVEVSERVQNLINESEHYNKALMYFVARIQSASNPNMSEDELSCHIESIYKQNNWIDNSTNIHSICS